mgnify:CR=1 FL=1
MVSRNISANQWDEGTWLNWATPPVKAFIYGPNIPLSNEPICYTCYTVGIIVQRRILIALANMLYIVLSIVIGGAFLNVQ